jgi:ABC-type sugar transport system ATPase subunit
MSVAENFWLYDGFPTLPPIAWIDTRTGIDRCTVALEKAGLRIDVRAKISDIAPSERSLVAIARMLYRLDTAGHPILVMDEPTAALADAEVERLFETLRSVISRGATVIYVTHRVGEIFDIANHVIVLRDGRAVFAAPIEATSSRELVEVIVGRQHEEGAESGQFSPTGEQCGASSPWHATGRQHASGVLLRARGLRGRRLVDVGFELGPGEILGITGLAGCGKSELARIVAGAQTPSAGELELDGKKYAPAHPRQARRGGVGYVPQDRRSEGLIGSMTVVENLSLPVLRRFSGLGWIRRVQESQFAKALITSTSIQPPVPTMVSANLSGGNQQKVVIARNVGIKLRLLVLDEMCQGIDVAARQQLLGFVRDLAADGLGVLFSSSDYSELIAVASRIMVLDRGRVATEVRTDGMDDTALAKVVLSVGHLGAGEDA